MTKRDAIEAMADAIVKEAIKREQCRETIANKYLAFATAAYERFAEMAKAERKARSTPLTPGPTAEAVAH